MATFAYWAFALLIMFFALCAALPWLGRRLAESRERDTFEYGEH